MSFETLLGSEHLRADITEVLVSCAIAAVVTASCSGSLAQVTTPRSLVQVTPKHEVVSAVSAATATAATLRGPRGEEGGGQDPPHCVAPPLGA